MSTYFLRWYHEFNVCAVRYRSIFLTVSPYTDVGHLKPLAEWRKPTTVACNMTLQIKIS